MTKKLKMNKEALKEILQAGYDRNTWKTVLLALFGNDRVAFYAHPQAIDLHNNDIAQSLHRWGEIMLDDDEETLQLYEVTLHNDTKIERSRIKVNQLIAHHVRTSASPNVLVSFSHNPEVANPKWRLSFVGNTEHYNEDGDLVSQQTQAKRYTYVFGTQDTHKTAIERLLTLTGEIPTLAAVFRAFSVEKLSKDFFKEYLSHYEAFVNDLTTRNKKQKVFKGKAADKAMRDFCKKLLGRVVFLYFIQKKGWLGVPHQGDPEEGYREGRGDLAFMQTYFAQVQTKGEAAKFYESYLTRLFFDTLSSPRSNQQPLTMPDGSQCWLPYLNGGLFDEENKDYRQLNFDPELFVALFGFFERYNFTVAENNPDEQEVAVDPEMLGNIFENLLEDNKDKGTFYTPKAIVSYMTQESLLQYLQTHLNTPNKAALEQLVRHKSQGNTSETQKYLRKHAKQIKELLDVVTICDPAIGSGAFPMGILHEILEIKTTLDWTLDRAAEKKAILQRNIYGVDIEQGAIDIARLRFWLSIIIEEEVPTPLPNLDYKIMQGNSLLQSFEGVDLSFDDKIIKGQKVMGFNNQQKSELQKLTKDYYSASNAVSKRELKTKIDAKIKGHIKSKFEKKQKSLSTLKAKAVAKVMANKAAKTDSNAVKKRKAKALAKAEKEVATLQQQLADTIDKLKRLHTAPTTANKPYFLWKLFFQEVFAQGGFDIVLGNPPYIQLQKIKEQAAQLANENYQTFSKSADIYCLFYEKGFGLLKEHGVLSFITANKWMRAKFGKEFRVWLKTVKIEKLIDFGDLPVFTQVITYPCIFQISKNTPQNIFKGINVETLDYESLHEYIDEHVFDIDASLLNEQGWVLTSKITQNLIAKIKSQGVTLKEWDMPIYRGLITGLNEAFVIDEATKNSLITKDAKSSERIKPFLEGKQIKRYKQPTNPKHLILFPKGWTNEQGEFKNEEDAWTWLKDNYSSLSTHLNTFREKAKKRGDKGNYWWELRACAYYEEFEKPKLIYPNICKQPEFTYDLQKFYTNQKCFIISKDDKYLLTVLNSQVINFLFKNILPKLQGGFYEPSYVFLKDFPIPQIPEAEQAPFVAKAEQILAAKAAGQDTTALEAEVDLMVYCLYGLGYREVKIVDPNFALSKDAYQYCVQAFAKGAVEELGGKHLSGL
ncbi:DNA modification methylase [Microscilla marina ATCC 23134]|uniref:site-specific DNA-methyltransferase (adenine-specific) n=2 Tax=Microscilla marina TaxID=1027 RepID=A1ZWE7_MICM2|nr:DNA modification methylase [Microscilla marina ATCC 23134]